jgi:hypothetical protein
VNIAGREHRSGLIRPVFGLEPTGDSLLAMAENFAVASIHSKWPFVGCDCRCGKHISTNKDGHFELFLTRDLKNHAC